MKPEVRELKNYGGGFLTGSHFYSRIDSRFLTQRSRSLSWEKAKRINLSNRSKHESIQKRLKLQREESAHRLTHLRLK